MDNFRDSVEPFKFACTAAKLDIIEVSKVNDKGEFTVVVRNGKSVQASDTEILFKPDKFEKEIKLDGPKTVDPFGVAEYHYQPEKSGKIVKPSLATLLATCSNCG